ncbi:DUF2399 domain-containing protein [Streptomyces sp. NPDC059783]|uniref:DUF2399 domain-containing protein n=1 Tax=Streptomyces sp. NPDC059783 TaxID=3346944 RepID=UPI00366773C5
MISSAVAAFASLRNARGPRSGRIKGAPWDPELAEAMTEHDIAVGEELVADVLLGELAVTTRQQHLSCCL